jgi:hypothetical protein
VVAVGCFLVAGTSAVVIAQSSVVATPAVTSDLTIVQVVQDVYALLQRKASTTTSNSLNPEDPSSRYYVHP